MKLFKTTDQKLAECGFYKVQEDDRIVSYEREIDLASCTITQHLDLEYDENGRHIINSYFVNSRYQSKIYVGLNMYEIKICIKKMKEMGWKVVNNRIHIR